MVEKEHVATSLKATSLACIASFSEIGEQRKTGEWDFWCFAHAKNGAIAKQKERVEEGKE